MMALNSKGDMGATSNVKLNKQVDVTGGVTNAADLATAEQYWCYICSS